MEVRPDPSVKVVSLEVGPHCPHPQPQVLGEGVKEPPAFNFLAMETRSLAFSNVFPPDSNTIKPTNCL